jgi:hypothetical protein
LPRNCFVPDNLTAGENIIKRSANGHTTVKYITPDKVIIVKVSEELPTIFSAPLLE